MKTTLTLLTLLAFNFASAEVCFNAGTSKTIPYTQSFEWGWAKNKNSDFIILNSNSTGMLNPLDTSNKVKVYNIKTKEIKEYDKNLSDFSLLANDGSIVLQSMDFDPADYTQESNSSYKIKNTQNYLKKLQATKLTTINPKTGERKEHIGKIIHTSSQLFTPEKIVESEGGILIVGKGDDGTELAGILEPRKNSIGFDFTSSRNTVVDENGKLKIYDGNKLIYQSQIDKSYFPVGTGISSSNFYNPNGAGGETPTGKFQLIKTYGEYHGISNYAQETETTAKYLVFDKAANNHRFIEIPGNFAINLANKKATSSKEDKILLSDLSGGGLNVLDIKSGKVKKISDLRMNNPIFDKNNNICGTVYENFTSENASAYDVGATTSTKTVTELPRVMYKCVSENGKVLSNVQVSNNPYDSITPIAENEFLIASNNQGGVGFGFGGGDTNQEARIVKPNLVCPKSIVFEDCNCDSSQPNNNSNLSPLLNLDTSLLCLGDYNESAWSTRLPRTITKLDDKGGLLWLKKFSKPNGFDGSKDLNILKTLLDSGMPGRFPGEFKAAMFGVLHYSTPLYEEIVQQYPAILKISPSSSKEDCLTAEEKRKIETSKAEFLKSKISKLHMVNEGSLAHILATGNDILNEVQKDKLAEDLADIVVERMGTDPQIKGIFPSKIYKFSYNDFKKQLGLDYKDLSDVTVVREDGKLKILQLGVNSFSDSKKSKSGIHLKVLSSLNETSIADNHKIPLKWTQGKKEYSAEVNISRDLLQNDITPANLSPNYKEMKKDKPFRGLIVAGTNLGQPTTENVVQEYLEYYSEQGFDFEEASPVDNLPDFLKSRVTGSDPAHYIVKEAHSDGDEKNLFRINKKGKVLLGTRENDDGTKEIVEIVYPGTDMGSTLISNNEFGKWMQEREKEKSPELIYLNSSCWSFSKATYEISAAKTSKLINIPTLTSMVTFSNTHKNVMFAAIDGFRKEKTYQEIREDMNVDPTYKNGTSNVMIFPDEERYESRIRKTISIPLNIDTKIFVTKDNKEVPYSIEE